MNCLEDECPNEATVGAFCDEHQFKPGTIRRFHLGCNLSLKMLNDTLVAYEISLGAKLINLEAVEDSDSTKLNEATFRLLSPEEVLSDIGKIRVDFDASRGGSKISSVFIKNKKAKIALYRD